ncbi:MAG: hypothetical protein E7314_07960, partial [Clostridiales bacterium]|nr:hypothetical protein [Clostridiales bacterium]
MANPAVIGAVIKLLADKDVWKGIGLLIATLCVPIILIIIALLSIQSGFAKHNNEAIDTVFNNKSVSLLAPREYKEHIKDMKKAFKKIDEEVEKNEEDDGLDSTRIKAVFYALFFKEEVLFETEITEDDEEIEVSKVDFEKFVNCFVSAERLPEVYRRIQNGFDIEISPEDKANAT